MDELKEVFSIEGLSKAPAVFDYEKLKWFNSEYIKQMPADKYEEKALPVLRELCPDYINIKKLSELLHTRIAYFGEIKEQIKFVIMRMEMDSSLYTNKKNKTTPELCREILTDVIPVLESVEDWNNDTLFTVLKEYAASVGKKAGAVMWAVRVAVGRQAVTPGGATELMEVFGKNESIDRIKTAVEELA